MDLIIAALLGLPIIAVIFAFRMKTNHFIPSGKDRFPQIKELFLHDPDRWSGFFVLALSFCIWGYVNLYSARQLLFSSLFHGLVTYILVIIAIFLTVRKSKLPLGEKPIWSPENWTMLITPIFLILYFISIPVYFIGLIIDTWNSGEIIPLILIFIFGGTAIKFGVGLMFWLTTAFSTLITTIIIAQFNFALLTLALDILGMVYNFFDTKIIDFYAIPKLIHDSLFEFSNTDNFTSRQQTFIYIYLTFYTVVSLIKIAANRSALPISVD